MNVSHRLLIYALGGVFTEVLFTSMKSLFLHRDITLNGKTQLWVILIYTFGGMWFEILEWYMQRWQLIYRLPIYVTNIYIIEYMAGMLLDKIIGECPWKYTGWTSLDGYIQLSYIPFWTILSTIANQLIFYLRTHKLVACCGYLDSIECL